MEAEWRELIPSCAKTQSNGISQNGDYHNRSFNSDFRNDLHPHPV